MAPLLVGGVVVAGGISFGGINGYAVDPARDLAPRFFSEIAGFKNNGLVDAIIWVEQCVGRPIGRVLGAVIYDGAVGNALKQAAPPVGDRGPERLALK